MEHDLAHHGPPPLVYGLRSGGGCRNCYVGRGNGAAGILEVVMAVTIPPLPMARRAGSCPWCNAGLCDSHYEDSLPEEVEDLEDNSRCPECDRPIAVKVYEQIITTYDISIEARRTETDKKYMQHMGLNEPKRKRAAA